MSHYRPEYLLYIYIHLHTHTHTHTNTHTHLQVYLAFPGTMGATWMDYNVVDLVVCPHHHREFYTERLLYMPHCYQTNSFKDLYSGIFNSSKLATRAEHGLPPEPAFIFCNFCQLGRITSELFHSWMHILRRVPLSVLWLLRSKYICKMKNKKHKKENK
jgi:protein O-GlcNAc transferase